MSRVKLTDKKLREKTGQRLSLVIEGKLNLTFAEASSLLGYKDASTLYKSRYGETIPHPEKLIRLCSLFKKRRGEELDLHWLLTGKGHMVYPGRGEINNEVDMDIIKLIDSLSLKQKQALNVLVSGL